MAELNVIFLGAPGSGKGTQATRFAERHRIPHISTGDMLRAAVREGTPLGREVEGFISRGGLVPDATVITLLVERLARPDATGGGVLDGFPRTLPQAEALDRMLAEHGQRLKRVVAIEVPEEALVGRLVGRRSCPKCGAPYHVQFKRPKLAGVCDSCGTELIQRNDDTEATVRERFETYRRQTAPLCDYYQRQGMLRRVSGEGEVEEIAKRVEEAVAG
jgi:adenylate kinase